MEAAAAVAEQQPARPDRAKLAERIDAILQRHFLVLRQAVPTHGTDSD
jgi:hypothetical protein